MTKSGTVEGWHGTEDRVINYNGLADNPRSEGWLCNALPPKAAWDEDDFSHGF